MMVLPIEGLRYYIVHAESGKYVHPLGGSDRPGDRTKLVWHGPGGRLALQFIFEDGQIKHYGSGKYIHPLGGQAGNGVSLCLYTGSDGERTGVRLVSEEGRTYLKHPKSQCYVHPRGGSIAPSNGTELIYYHGIRPGISITILPAEGDSKVIETKFDTRSLSASPEDTIRAETTVKNHTDVDQPMEAKVQYDRSIENSFTYQFEEKASFSISSGTEVSAELPGVGGAKANLTYTFGLEFGASQTTTKSTTTGVQNSITVKPTVRAGRTLKVVVTTVRKHGDVPFVMTLESPSGVRFKRRGTVKAEYFFDQQVSYENILEPEIEAVV